MLNRMALGAALVALLAAACGSDGAPPASSPTEAPERATQPAGTPAGPQAIVEPDSGPPGVEITVRGSGWEPGVLVDLTGELAPGVTANPYESVVPGPDGSFTASFRLESAPDGTGLSTGRFDLIARSAGEQVVIPFRVETRRPVGSSAPGG